MPLLHLRSRAALLPALLLTASATLTACGSDAAGGSDAVVGLDAVTVRGDVGTEPDVTFEDGMDVVDGDDVVDQETETIVNGDGAELEDGDKVLVDYWIGNGHTGEVAETSYSEDTSGTLVTLGGEPAQPATVADLVSTAASALLEPGTNVGSRVVSVGTPDQVLGVLDLPEFQLANRDPVVLVLDLVEKPLAAPEGEKVAPPAWVPGLVIKNDAPVAWQFKKAPRPNGELRSFTRIVGDGPEVREGDLLVVDYLGQVYGGEEPFDDSYSRGEPATFGIGVGQVIQGWDQALVGQTVGSRVILAIPPALGYGEQGNEQAGISGTDTLYFVVDILGAA